jgi:exopolyphosphatase/guanosine-5'-triphosphate,3'-diphosphate pyrophosphatase
MSTAGQPDETPSADTVAAIDIGSNSVRMVVADVMADGSFEVLEQLQRAVRLGQDTFRDGRIGGQALRAATGILRDYRRVLDLYRVKQIRTVATSAVREAANSDTFLDRVFMATGLDVEVIATSEESRLTVSAVRRSIGDGVDVGRGHAMIAEVGGGSTLLTILHEGEIAAAQSLRLGSIRMQEALSTTHEPPDRLARMLRRRIANALSGQEGSLPFQNVRLFVVVGGDARFAASQVGKPMPEAGLSAVERADLDGLVERVERQSPEELARRFGLDFATAETLGPALLVYQALLHATQAGEMIVAPVSMRDGLLLDLARQVTGQEDETLSDAVVQSALTVAEKYKVDLSHAGQVADLADRLFDELRAEHGLGPRHRLLLRVASLVHEVGGFVSTRAHHKHSHYLLANSEIFGLTRNEQNLVALVARYHRRSCPKPSHVEYMSLPRERRLIVSKLAALLRVADALEAGHAQQVREIRCARRDEELVVYVPGVSDLTLERRAVQTKGDLFEDIYGMRVRLEEADLPLA